MVCDPFLYSEYSEMKNIISRLLIGCSFCFVLACDNLIYIVTAAIVLQDPLKYMLFDSPEMSLYKQISRGLEIFHLVKFALLKVLYSGVVIFLTHKTRIALMESENMANAQNQAKESVHKRILCFSLIPLGINFFYLIPELLNEISPAPQTLAFATDEVTPPMHVRSCITACMVTVGSFSYFIAYPIVFPAVRHFLCCRKDQ